MCVCSYTAYEYLVVCVLVVGGGVYIVSLTLCWLDH
jgi:hypothetical protein